MTSGPTYGQGFIELEPRLSRDFLTKINSQLDRAFSNVKLDVDDTGLRNIRSQLELVEGSADRAAKEVATIARESGDADTHLKALAGHLGISEDAARRMATEILESQRSADRLETSALQAARALGVSEDEARRFASAMAKVDDSDVAVRRLEGSLGRIRSSLSTMAVSAVAFFGVRGIVGAATSARDSFIDLGESINAVQVVFGEGADTIFAFSDQVAQSAGLAKSEFQQMSTVLGAALQNAGLDADEAANKTIILTQRAADLASVFNTDVADALGAIQAALRGEGDPIERFGVTLSATAVDAEAAALGYSRVAGEFDNTAKAAARISLILEQTNRVAGDFANTSDSLANRQRIAAAEAENLRAELGEALLPVFESLVEVGPQVVEGLKDLAPALSALAVSAGELATSTPGVLDFMDAVNLFTDLPRGFGQLIDVGKTFGGLFTGVFDSLEEIGRLDFSNLGDNFTAVGDAAQSAMERIQTQGLIDDLREGGDAATVLANRLAEVGKKGKLSPEFIRNLREIAGTDLTESASVLGALVENAERLGLSAEELALLTVEFSRLRNELLPVGNEIAQAARAMSEDLPAAIPRTVSSLSDVRRAADDAGISLEDLAFSADPAIVAMREGLTAPEQFALRLDALGSSADLAAGFLAERLRPSIVDAGEALTDLNKDGKVSADEFIQNLEDMTVASLQFSADLAKIFTLSPELAAALQQLPRDVAIDLLRDFKNDPAAIFEAQEALLGDPAVIAKNIRDIVRAAIELARKNPSQQQIEEFTAFVTTLDVPGAEQAVRDILSGVLDVSFAELDAPDLTPVVVESIEGMNSVQLVASFDKALDASFADVELPDITPIVIDGIEKWNSTTIADAIENALFANVDLDLTQEGIQSRATYLDGLSTPQPGEISKLRSSITATLDAAIYRDSPPKLFLDAGKDSVAAFWSPFEDVPLTFPGLDLAKSFDAARAASFDVTDSTGTGGPLVGSMTVNNPIGEPTEDSVQAALIEVAISPIVNRLVSAGSSL